MLGVSGVAFGVWCLVFGVWGLVFGVWGVGFGVQTLGLGVALDPGVSDRRTRAKHVVAVGLAHGAHTEYEARGWGFWDVVGHRSQVFGLMGWVWGSRVVGSEFWVVSGGLRVKEFDFGVLW